ncbi:MAG TPA: hypothetical protein VFV33_18120 [Gemmatimonadaceae bacterium]|nr:hypothetical protein [Gemmatimonadaceae bacterium]
MADNRPFHGLLERIVLDGTARLVAHAARPSCIPCPSTGHALKVASIDAQAQAICPRCMAIGRGAFVTFVGDLRMAYACPGCDQFVWLASA